MPSLETWRHGCVGNTRAWRMSSSMSNPTTRTSEADPSGSAPAAPNESRTTTAPEALVTSSGESAGFPENRTRIDLTSGTPRDRKSKRLFLSRGGCERACTERVAAERAGQGWHVPVGEFDEVLLQRIHAEGAAGNDRHGQGCKNRKAPGTVADRGRRIYVRGLCRVVSAILQFACRI